MTCVIAFSKPKPTMPVSAVAAASSSTLLRKALAELKYVARQDAPKYTMTANMVPVCNITSSMVSSGEVGSRPIHFSAMMTWAELDTGSSSPSTGSPTPSRRIERMTRLRSRRST